MSTRRPHIAFVVPDAWTAWLFYRHLLEGLQQSGAAVTVLSAADRYVSRLDALGVHHVPIPYARFIDPIRDIALTRKLFGFYTRHHTDIVQNVTIKANLYGGLAASAAGVESIINTVEGAGVLYSESLDLRLRAVRAVVELGLRRVRPRVARYWFVNRHDRDTFVRRGLATEGQSIVAVATGVDTHQFDPSQVSPTATAALRAELGLATDGLLVTLVAGRLLRTKGVPEFLEIACRLKAAKPKTHALLVGPAEPGHPDALPLSIVEEAVEAGTISWLPFREDIATVYRASDVVVVPTRYAEGTPKGIMEALAMGCAVVATDTAPIREMISNGRDALLVPAGDPRSMFEAVCSLLDSPEWRARLERRARRIALSRFDAVNHARAAVDAVYRSLPAWSAVDWVP